MLGYSVVNIKGQVTIPSSIRKRVGIDPKGIVIVTEVANTIVVSPVADVFSLRGSVAPKNKPENFKKMRESFAQYLGSKRGKK